MRSSYTKLMQSKYFNPAFNCAIFDGPVRIYFAQPQEESVLQVYFMIQKELGSEFALAKDRSKASGANILIMAYPTNESFELVFGKGSQDSQFEVQRWDEDVVVGLRSSKAGTQDQGMVDINAAKVPDLATLMDVLRLTMKNWRPVEINPPLVSMQLC